MTNYEQELADALRELVTEIRGDLMGKDNDLLLEAAGALGDVRLMRTALDTARDTWLPKGDVPTEPGQYWCWHGEAYKPHVTWLPDDPSRVLRWSRHPIQKMAAPKENA